MVGPGRSGKARESWGCHLVVPRVVSLFYNLSELSWSAEPRCFPRVYP